MAGAAAATLPAIVEPPGAMPRDVVLPVDTVISKGSYFWFA